MVTPRSMDTWPSSGDSSFMIRREIVDFPAPFGPTRPTFSPRWMAAAASTKRMRGPCCLLTESRRITALPEPYITEGDSVSALRFFQGGDAVTNESILISEVIPATPQRIFSAWMDSAEHSAFTGDKAMVVARVGGEHRAANGYIQGRTLELNEGSRIVQSWRTTEFPPESPDSRVEITLEPTLGGTLVTLLHTDIPVGQGDRYRQCWNEYYLSRLKAYFSDGAADADGENTP